jgi:signal transduction histidine kinase/CheY-like chemotaxis protein
MTVRRLSLKHKLVGVVLVSSVAALLIAYAALLIYEFHSYRREASRNLSALAGLIASNSSAAMIYDDKDLAQENLTSLRAEPDVKIAALYDQNGRLYAAYPANLAPSQLPAAPGPEGMTFHGTSLRLFTPVTQDRRHVGTLYLASDLNEMYGRFEIYGGVLLLVLIGSLVVSLFLSNFFQRRISEPILQLAKMARIISEEGNYSIRAQTSRDDEVGDLTRAFNAMLVQTQASHADVERARDEALAASRAKDDFLAALSHELRTPLNPVLLLASDAVSRADLPAAIRADFEVIRKNVELEARLIDDLLDLTRITRGKLTLEHQLVDPQLALRDAIATVQADADDRRLDLSFVPSPGHPMVYGDSIRLQQIFWNLLKNAVKFAPEGGWVEVSVSEDAANQRVLIKVQDNGIGITAEELPRLFQVFSQGDHAGSGSHRFGGLGLGLAISHTLAELQSGTIRASSAGRGAGATFVVDLPLAAERGSSPEAPLPSAEAIPAATPAPEHCLLLVEDHAPTRTVLAHMLEGRGFRVLTAASLAESRAVAAQNRIEILISDIGLPDGTGYELMVELSAKYPVKGIALTGYGMEHDLADSRRSGFAAHLTKPVSIQAVNEALTALLKEQPS